MDIVTLEYAASLRFEGMTDPNSQMLLFDIKLSKQRVDKIIFHPTSPTSRSFQKSADFRTCKSWALSMTNQQNTEFGVLNPQGSYRLT